MSKNLSYRAEIDGLRALAVIPVMLFHAGADVFSGGYVGVDVFFVISGFLITSIIYREVCKGQFSYLNFYERRARRIFPALYLVTFTAIIPAWFLLIPSDFRDFSENIIGVVTFSSNIVLWLQSDYFSQEAELKPLLHTWSLAVEEQYYVFFPVLLMALHQLVRKYTIHCLVVILVISLLLSHWVVSRMPTANYYLLPTRAWELFIGSVVALLYTCQPWNSFEQSLRRYVNGISLFGLTLIIVPIFTFNSQTPFPSLWAAIPTVGTALFILFAKPSTLAHNVMINPFFVSIGIISYSAYLWHQPVYAFARLQTLWPASGLVMACAFGMSLLLAYASWRFVEQPLRNRKKVSSRFVWLVSFLGGSLLIGFSIVSLRLDGFENRFKFKAPLTHTNFDLPKRSNGWCFYSVDTDSSLTLGRTGFDCPLGASNGTHKILLFGDSFAGMYEPFWHVLGTDLNMSVNSITTNWCHPSFTESFWWQNETRALDQCLLNRAFVSKSLDDYDVVVVSAVWSRLDQNGLIQEVYELIETLTQQHDKNVVIMAQPPAFNRNSVARSVYNQGHLIYRDDEVRVKRINERLHQLALGSDKTFFIEREAMFNHAGNPDGALSKDGVPYSWDGGHLSIYGSEAAGRNFLLSPGYTNLRQFIQGQ